MSGTKRLLVAAAILTLAVIGASAQSQTGFPFNNASLPTAERVNDLVKRMTLEEKVSQMVDYAPAIPRLGIPAYDWWSEGLHGIARSGYATMFPQAIGMAATWDRELIGQEGDVVATEARAKYNRAIAEGNRGRYFGLTIWSPNINIFRDPRWGRGQETYGEDPYLTGTLGVAFTKGLQGSRQDAPYYKTIATPKHFAVHSGPESTRHTANIQPSPYDLGSTYLPAFRAAIVDGKADSLMCAYNAVDGLPACANAMLLQRTLRDAWGFKGYVTSDCDAIQDFSEGHKTSPDPEHAAATAVLAGTDLDCGGTYKTLVAAVHRKLLPESAIDTSVKRLFTARIELGMFDPEKSVPYNSIPFSEDDSTAHRTLAQKAAEEAMVLLKNENGTLPLKAGGKAGVKTIAVVGPNAASLLALEGNYNAIPSHPVLPVDGIAAQFAGATVLYAQGAPYADGLELPAPRTLFHTANGAEGLTGAYFANADLTGTPVVTGTDSQIDFDWTHASPVPGLSQGNYSVRWTGTLTPPRPGAYQFGIKVGRCGGCANRERDVRDLAITVDGKPVDVTRHTPGTDEPDTVMPEFDLTFADARPHAITIEYRHSRATDVDIVSLRWMAPAAAELDQAVAVAKKADVVVAFVGLTSELESEETPVHAEGFSGGDRTSIDLPATQEKLLEAVGAVCKQTGKPLVVVLENGSALAVNWAATHADAILEAWYPGEAGGAAIAQTLAGKNNPGGKLPVTFYTGVNELPAFENYSMRNRTYRYYTGEPLYGFGYGLSYTRFAFSGLKLSDPSLQAGKGLIVEADVKNTGKLAGDEVAELYMMPPKTDLSPQRQLIAFDRVHLRPGERKHLRFQLDPRQLSVVDATGKRAMMAGQYTLSLGGGQPDATPAAPGATGKFAITGEQDLPK